MKQNPEIFSKAAEEAGLMEQKRVSVRDAIHIKALARLSMGKIRDLRNCLNKVGCNFWPSERKMRELEISETEHVVNESSVESGLMSLKRTAKCEETEMLAYIRVTNLGQFLIEIFNNLPGELDRSMFDNEIWILFAGDKGGGHMKFHVEIINSITSGSVDNVHLFCMFEAADTLENMWKVFGIFREQIVAIQKDDFSIDGRKVKIFLGGDFHFLDDMLGHQGSAATFPGCLDLVTLDHLRNHGGLPHTPKNCSIALRSVEDFDLNYNENLCDDRANGDMRENGKYHNSVIEQMLFPIRHLDFVVPPVLHIVLGITLLLYNILFCFCQQFDQNEGENVAGREERELQMQEWQESSISLSGKQQELEKLGEDVVEIENRISRIEAVLTGDHVGNLRIAKLGGRNSRKGAVQKCDSTLVCCITPVDTQVKWVQCDNCQKWLHAFCECLTLAEELSVETQETYICLSCRDIGQEDLVGILKEKVSQSLGMEDILRLEIVDLCLVRDELKAKNSCEMGAREKLLNQKLEDIKVV